LTLTLDAASADIEVRAAAAGENGSARRRSKEG
jgi:hypothetical protein